MVIDSSALVAIMTGEAAANALIDSILADPVRMIAAPTVLETSIVLERRSGQELVAIFDEFLRDIRASIEPFEREHLTAARAAYHRFGKGRHPAALDFGDCFSYALAIVADEPLLFCGGDFALTDVRPA
jgi:ribonuclease VapC